MQGKQDQTRVHFSEIAIALALAVSCVLTATALNQGNKRNDLLVSIGPYGTDCNHDHILARGPTNKSTRPLASISACFNVHDPRPSITVC